MQWLIANDVFISIDFAGNYTTNRVYCGEECVVRIQIENNFANISAACFKISSIISCTWSSLPLLPYGFTGKAGWLHISYYWPPCWWMLTTCLPNLYTRHAGAALDFIPCIVTLPAAFMLFASWFPGCALLLSA